MNKFDKFCHKYEHFGVKNLMLFIAVCNIAVFLYSSLFPDIPVMSWLMFSWPNIMKGELWRLITFVFLPADGRNILILLIVCYFYYWIGKTLESEWGRLKFNIFYLSGMAATIIFCALTDSIGTSFYLNLSLFFAYATLFPEQKILLFFIIPIKVKYIALVEVILFFIVPMLQVTMFPDNLLPLTAILNYFIFFWPTLLGLVKRQTVYTKKRVDFKTAVRQSRARPSYEGHVHKCKACGITDTQDPNMEFRYCSMCAHYECYCSQHIFTHEHIKE